VQGKARQGKGRKGKEGKAKQCKAGQGRLRQGNEGQGWARLDKSGQEWARQGEAGQGRARQIRAGPRRAGQGSNNSCLRTSYLVYVLYKKILFLDLTSMMYLEPFFIPKLFRDVKIQTAFSGPRLRSQKSMYFSTHTLKVVKRLLEMMMHKVEAKCLKLLQTCTLGLDIHFFKVSLLSV
jgi:hypothetical protein